jgi:mono/diheme cytochrome c family protein
MRMRTTSVLCFLALSITGGVLAADSLPAGRALISELGCASCHVSLQIPSTLRERTPDLSSAGLRYNPAYLFDFLRHPVRVKHHLGRARMPNFQFDDKEALALVKFLRTQQEVGGAWPPLPPEIQSTTAAQNISRKDFQNELSTGSSCLSCHRFEGNGGTVGIELSNIGYRLQRDWLKRYLVAPSMFGVPPEVMPPHFYRIPPGEPRFEQLVPRAAQTIENISSFLFSLAEAPRKELEQKFAAAESAHPETTASLGEAIFRAENCGACHRHPSISPRADAAPDLATESSRVRPQWLAAFLKKPAAIRPFGFHPGDGSRMPDFGLSDEEVASIRSVLLPEDTSAKQSHPLSAFSTQKATLLLTEKLSCLGCHRFGERGGRIGPDLAQASFRLQPKHLFDMIRDPRRAHPGVIMPKIPLPEETIQLIGWLILQQPEIAASSGYLSLADDRILLPMSNAVTSATHARSNYLAYCAACHGPEGLGNGWNAQFLAAKPTMHANAQFMSTRTDDTLFDGIYSGSYILGKSPLMPPWGQSFTPLEIRELVAYLRTLCHCEQPAWAADNRPLAGRAASAPKP